MNKVFIECDELIYEYKINKQDIIKQLEAIKIEKDRDFIITYENDFRFTLAGEMSKNNTSIILTNIIKADDFKEMDNSDLFQREQGDCG
ncbi:hypothetical protein JT739_11140 [Tepidanaerobacter sp. GT38]|jgi:hypothetical protein|uniref:hypothetical protein n=1 Tax=Tepidanaerobacter sp. GT38 TaxID=2722793 RepID=UPI001F3C8238|nr:hypothetical protein [Tepidanaerobacter sp. GT38]MCG1013145.1 hypothetical protein [Tepidanaerobacter sp. GT38]